MKQMLYFAYFVVAGGLFAAPAMAEPYIMLEVNGEGVRASEVEKHWQRLFPEGDAPALETTAPGIRHNILRAVAGERLLLQAAEEDDIADSDAFKEKLEAARKQLLINEFLIARGEEAASDRALNRAYLRYVQERKDTVELRASHILLESEEEAKEIYQKLVDGANFTPLAREYSRDPGSAAQGGDLGYFTPDQMVKPFADAAMSLEVGGFSAPVQSPFGWHVITLTDKRPAVVAPFNEVRAQLRAELQKEASEAYVERLLRDAKIVLYDGKGNVLPFDKTPEAITE